MSESSQTSPKTCAVQLTAMVTTAVGHGEIPVRLLYDAADPYAVLLTVRPGTHETRWLISRDDILATVKPGAPPIGDGDAQWTTFARNGGGVTILRLRVPPSPSGADLIFLTSEVIAFIADTEAIVPIGAETGIAQPELDDFLAALAHEN